MDFNQEVKLATDPIYRKISKVMPEIEWAVHAPYIHKINKLKKEKNAVILAHNSVSYTHLTLPTICSV